MNPNTIEAQVESAIVFGLAAALFGEITLKDGRVQQNNFHDYRLRINEAPVVEVHLVRAPSHPGASASPGPRRSRRR